METLQMKKKEKLIFAWGDVFGGGAQALIGVLYLIFLTDVIGINPALAATAILVSKIWDAVSDPLMGVISDNTRTKIGRRRPYILGGGFLLVAVQYGFLSFLPFPFSSINKKVLIFLSFKKNLYCPISHLLIYILLCIYKYLYYISFILISCFVKSYKFL